MKLRLASFLNCKESTQTRSMFKQGGVFCLALAGTVMTSSAIGQANEPILEEIVITAERREVNLQDTPISATVLTGDALVKKGVDNVDELQQVAPSLAISTVNRSTFINIRGVGIAQSAPTSNPGVAYYLDGVFIPHEFLIGQTFYDLGSVEVLRGPQGTLTGQNSTGGALYVRSPGVVFSENNGYVDQTFGSDGWSRTVGAANLAIGETAGLRIAGIYENKDGYVENLGPSAGMDPGSSELTSYRMNFAWQPSEKQSYNFRYEAFDYETGNVAIKDRQDTNPDPFEISYDGRQYLNQKGYRASIEGRWMLNDSLELRALGSKQDAYTKDQADGDRSSTDIPIPPAEPNTGANRLIYPGRVSRARTDYFTDIVEVNLISDNDGGTNWVVGAFYMEDDVPVELYRDHRNTDDFVSASNTTIVGPENTSKSIFGQIDTELSDSLILNVGLRYSDDEQLFVRTIAGPDSGTVGKQDSTATTGRIGLNYYSSSDTMWYGTFSKGYKAGGVNLFGFQGPFEPEENLVYEFGVKTTVSDGRLRINGAIFYSDYSDFQLISLQSGFPFTENAASGEIYGFELEALGRFDRLEWDFGISVLNGTFAKDVTLNNANIPPNGANQLVQSGDDLPFAPDLTFNAGLQYDLEFGDILVIPRIQISHIDEQISTPFPSGVTMIDERTLVDLKLIIEPSENFLLEAFVTNATDDEYVSSQIGNSSSADGGEVYGAPRQFGVRAKYDF